MTRRWRPGRFLLLESALAAAIVFGLINIAKFWSYQGYLPAPFVFDINDTFMDWFNTAQYAHNPGAYDIWRSIYPPLSFMFLQLVGDPSCYATSPFDARDCDVVGIGFIVLSYIGAIVAAWCAFWKADRTTFWPRAVGFAFCLPLLYAFERGNLLMVAFICFALAYSDVVKARWVKVILAGITINLKYYLIFPAVALAIKRSWRDVELIGISAVAVYLVSLVWVGSGTPLQIADNLSDWVVNTALAVWDQVYYSTTYSNLLWFDLRQYPVRDYVGSRVVDTAAGVIPVLIFVTRLVALAAIALAWLQPRAVSVNRLGLIIFLFSLVAQSPGGYVEVFIVFLLFVERAATICEKSAVICAYLISIPYDLTVGTFKVNNQAAWLSGRTLEVSFGFNFGAVIRPGMLLLILWLISIDTIIKVSRAHATRRARWDLSPEPSLLAAHPMSRPALA